MKYRSFVVAAGVALLSTALLSAQNNKTASSSGSGKASSDDAKAVTYVGCLGPGSSDGTYTLFNAKEKGAKGKAVTFKVVAASPKVNLEQQVTKEVVITGTMDSTPKAESGSDTAVTLPTFTATKVKWQADYCGEPIQ